MQANVHVQVTWEDQRDINTFGKINSDHVMALALISEAKVRTSTLHL